MQCNFYSTVQHEFTKHRSYVTNLLTARETWAESADANQRLDVVMVDFSKAFDKVPHKRLLFKLQNNGVSGKVLNWIMNFIEGRSMVVQVNDSISDTVNVQSGVPQGSVLGPELFRLYIDDLPRAIGSKCLLYADDLKVWANASSVDEADALQETLNQLENWSNTWQLPINREKCVVFPIGAPDPLGSYHFSGHLLRTEAQTKDLGVMLSHDFRTSYDTKMKVASASRMLGCIKRSFSRMSPHIFRTLFISHIRPILEYGQPAVWPLFQYEKDNIERVQRRGTKYVREIDNLSYEERLSKLNMFSMEYRRRRGDLIYARRILLGVLGEELQQFYRVVDSSSTRGHRWKLYKPRRARLDHNVTLSTRVINDWNGLPDSVISASSEESFKRKLDEHFTAQQGICCALHQ